MTEHLGKEAIDVVTKVKGIITGYACYMTSADQVLIEVQGDGIDRKASHWFDFSRVQIILEGINGEVKSGKIGFKSTPIDKL